MLENNNNNVRNGDSSSSSYLTNNHPRRAWATYLCNHEYLQGCLVLAYSLRKVQSQYKLVVMVPISPPMDPQDLEQLDNVSNIVVRPVDITLWQLKAIIEEKAAAAAENENIATGENTSSKKRYLWDHFALTWAKLSAWGLTEYDRLVLMDCDMLVQINIDQLLNEHDPSSASDSDQQQRERRLQLGQTGAKSYLDLPRGWIAAVHACTCNAMKNPSYPRSWTPDSCAYSQFLGNPCPPSHNTVVFSSEKHSDQQISDLKANNTSTPEGEVEPKAVSALAASFGLYAKNRSYFNSGLVVMSPCLDQLQRIQQVFQIAIHNPSDYLFPDQDVLNQVFLGHWKSLGYGYNALKTLPWSHPAVWNSSCGKSMVEIEQELEKDIMSVRNIHYIMEKPWNVQPEITKESNQFWELYKWWWQANEELLQEKMAQ